MRKHQSIDLLKLYSMGSANGWNEVLTVCHRTHDIARLSSLMYALQAGMDDIAKQKLNTEAFNVWYIRMLRSIENTLKAILREKYPNPFDNAHVSANPEFKKAQWKEIKKRRDHDFELFLRKSSY